MLKDGARGFWEKTLPDIHGEKDAEFFVRKSKDPAYQFGQDFKHVPSEDLVARVLSIKPDDLRDMNERIRSAGRSHVTNFIFGTYNLGNKTFRMNDTGIPIEVIVPAIFYPPIGVALIPLVIFLRSLYFFGRRNWWRHEATHARHHYDMKEHLRTKGEDDVPHGYEDLFEKAGLTIHESGLEELVTRWQSLREARGAREKLASGVSLFLYVQYMPFMGVRNLFNDAKEKIHRSLEDTPTARFIGKANLIAYSILFPAAAVVVQGDDFEKYIHSIEPAISVSLAKDLLVRGLVMYSMAVLGAAISSYKKGALLTESQKKEKLRASAYGVREDAYTRDYKFPFTYDPLKSFWRSVKLVRYLGKVWDKVPNYRRIATSSDIGAVRQGVAQRLQTARLSDGQKQFTMNALDDVLATVRPETGKPQDLYLKGQFMSALYLRAKELYS